MDVFFHRMITTFSKIINFPMVARKMTMICLMLSICLGLYSQATKFYWQQKIRYNMVVNMDIVSNQFTAHQSISYTNNSPDQLDRLYFHLYFNAFQPGSEMDVRSQTIPDPDPRIGARISTLQPGEQGFQKITGLQQGSHDLKFKVRGTILEVIPSQPVKPGQTIKLEMDYTAQVPLQIRRSGRDNAEGYDTLCRNGILKCASMIIWDGTPINISHGNFMEYGATFM
jgi:hypothetical protein